MARIIEEMPAPIQLTLYRALVWSGTQITDEQRNAAWKWLDENTPDYDIRDV